MNDARILCFCVNYQKNLVLQFRVHARAKPAREEIQQVYFHIECI